MTLDELSKEAPGPIGGAVPTSTTGGVDGLISAGER